MNKIDYKTLIETGQEDVHVMTTSKDKLLDIEITKDYKYRIKNPFLIALSVLLHLIVVLVLPVLLFLKYGIIVKGRRNIKHLKKSGAVSVSNHVLSLDSTIIAYSLFPKRVIYHALETNFKIPFIRHLVKIFGAIPIPSNYTARPNFMKATANFLKEGKVVHIFPEGSLWPNYDEIRNFKPGAFHFAVKNNVPIIPICLNFRTPRGFEKLLPNQNFITVHIGKPIYPNQELHFKQSVEELKNKSHSTLVRMNKFYKFIDKQKQIELEENKEDIL